MGKNQSKEVIISQAGNSGETAATTTSNNTHIAYWEVVLIVIGAIILCFGLIWCYQRIRKNMRKEIRREIARSQEIA